jgi:hypothetical protein
MMTKIAEEESKDGQKSNMEASSFTSSGFSHEVASENSRTTEIMTKPIPLKKDDQIQISKVVPKTYPKNNRKQSVGYYA